MPDIQEAPPSIPRLDEADLNVTEGIPPIDSDQLLDESTPPIPEGDTISIKVDGLPDNMSDPVDTTKAAEELNEKIYKHTLEDGREVTGNLDQVMKLCPVMGKMAREKAQAVLHKQDVAQRMAERGKAKRLAREENERPEKQTNVNKRTARTGSAQDKDNNIQQVAEPTITKAPLARPEAVAEKTAANVDLPQDAHNVQDQVKGEIIPIVVQLQENMMTERESAVKKGQSETIPHLVVTPPDQDPPKHYETGGHGDASAKVNSRHPLDINVATSVNPNLKGHEPPGDVASSKDPEVFLAAEFKTMPDSEVVDAEAEAGMVNTDDRQELFIESFDPPVSGEDIKPDTLLIGAFFEFDELEVGEVTEIIESSGEAVPFEEEWVPDWANLLAVDSTAEVEDESYGEAEAMPETDFVVEDFSDEVMDTYAELVALFAVDYDDEPPIEVDLKESLAEAEPAVLQMEPVEADTVISFEQFVSETSAEREMGSESEVNEIIEQAPDRSLEHTLVELSMALSEETEPHEGIEPIAAALQEVVETLNKLTIGKNDADQERPPVITPELTQKLLLLLTAIGYDNPRETLVEFMSQRSLEFLTQAIRYLYRLLDDQNQIEYLTSKSLSFADDQTDTSLATRLGIASVRYANSYA